jgi:hypothetical protein
VKWQFTHSGSEVNMRRCLGILILLGGLASCEATPTDTGSLTPGAEQASVKAPLHEVFFDDPAFALPDIDCGTFIIRETSFSDRIHVTTYFNEAGDPFRVRVQVQFKGVLTNLSTGKTLRDHAAFTNTFDFAKGTLTQTGISFHYTIRHEGLQLADNGRIVIDLETGDILFAAGPHDVTEQGLTAICPLLA